MRSSRPRAIFVLHPWAFDHVYGPDFLGKISERVDVVGSPLDADTLRQNPSILNEVEIILGSWGIISLDQSMLNAAPKLRGVFLGAGSVKGAVTEAFWARNIPIVSAYSANAIPVAEYTLAAIIFSLKHCLRYITAMQRSGRYIKKEGVVPGAFGSTVGLVSLGAIGCEVAQRVKQLDVRLIAHDPFCPAEKARKLGAELVSLEDIFTQSDVVSLHTPWMPETEGMITGELVSRMKTGATLINTARGAVMRENEMVAVLRERSDLTALLDVTWPEPPVSDSPLLQLPNVMLTPHIAGAMDLECRRLGQLVLEELDRFLASEPLQWAISRERAQSMA